MRKLLNFLTRPWRKFQEHRNFNRKLEELRKRDQFIYK